MPPGPTGAVALVACEKSCSIVGPGSLVDGVVGVIAARRVTIEGVTISGMSSMGVWTHAAKLVECWLLNNGTGIVGRQMTLASCTLSGNTMAVNAYKRATVLQSSITGNLDGVIVDFPSQKPSRAELTDSFVTDNAGRGIHAGAWVTLRNCEVSRNGTGVESRGNATILDSSISDNAEDGLVGGYAFSIHFDPLNEAYVENSTITDNGGYGISANWVHTVSSTVTGSCTSSTPRYECADVNACNAPDLDASSCNTSSKCYPDSGSWGACTLD
jgi:hypothetical protein